LAVAFWALGSAVASSAIFFSLSTVSNTISNVLYLLFYPLIPLKLPATSSYIPGKLVSLKASLPLWHTAFVIWRCTHDHCTVPT
jgi:hypothetical protein